VVKKNVVKSNVHSGRAGVSIQPGFLAPLGMTRREAEATEKMAMDRVNESECTLRI